MDKKTLETTAKEERLKYFREWRRKNPEKVKQHNKNYWEKKAKAKLKKEGKDHDTHQKTNNANSKGDR